MIEKPGIYDLSDLLYHADPVKTPSLSASICKILDRQSPLHAWTAHPRLNPHHQREYKREFDIGTAIHDLILRGDTSHLVIIEAADYRTNAAKEQREAAYAAGKTPLLATQAERLTAAATAVTRQLRKHEAEPAFNLGKPEQTLVWQDGATWCRAKLDWLPDAISDGTIIWDLKSTEGSAEPATWARNQLFTLGFDIQAAFYLRGIRALTGKEAQFGFLVVESSPPYAISALGLPPAVIALGERKIARAMHTWGACMRSNAWPGYPPIIDWSADAPPWEQARVEYREQFSTAVLEASANMQAPL